MSRMKKLKIFRHESSESAIFLVLVPCEVVLHHFADHAFNINLLQDLDDTNNSMTFLDPDFVVEFLINCWINLFCELKFSWIWSFKNRVEKSFSMKVTKSKEFYISIHFLFHQKISFIQTIMHFPTFPSEFSISQLRFSSKLHGFFFSFSKDFHIVVSIALFLVFLPPWVREVLLITQSVKWHEFLCEHELTMTMSDTQQPAQRENFFVLILTRSRLSISV